MKFSFKLIKTNLSCNAWSACGWE